MENFFNQYPYALFFIGCFFLLVENKEIKKTTNSNIIVLYIIFAITCIFSVGSYWKNSMIIMVLSFIELEILSSSEEKNILMVSAKYKLIDFCFIVVNKYKILSMMIISFLYYISNDLFRENIYLWIIYNFLISCLFLSNIGRIYKNKFNVKDIDEIEKEYYKATKRYIFPTEFGTRTQKALKKKIDMLLEIEDRTFKHRKSSYNIICWESLVYKLNKDYNRVDKIHSVNYFYIKYKFEYILKNLNKILQLAYRIFVVSIKALFSKKGLKRYLNRGYSTIEMQLIRTIGINSGYEETYIRKIYELIYSNVFFKSYERKRNYYHYLKNDEYWKYKIPYAYFKLVRTFINGLVFTNICEYYKYIRNMPQNRKISEVEKERIIYILCPEEIFIFILGLSKKYIDYNILTDYAYYINKYNLNIDKLKKIIDYIGNNVKK